MSGAYGGDSFISLISFARNTPALEKKLVDLVGCLKYLLSARF